MRKLTEREPKLPYDVRELRAWQERNGLQADGVWGQESMGQAVYLEAHLDKAWAERDAVMARYEQTVADNTQLINRNEQLEKHLAASNIPTPREIDARTSEIDAGIRTSWLLLGVALGIIGSTLVSIFVLT